MSKPVVIMDGTSFHYYRVTATISWCKKTGKEIMDYLIPHYFSCLNKFNKIHDVNITDIIFARDCPRDKIWRKYFFPAYKANRLDSRRSEHGPLII